nr:hypothetical protein [Sulfobacillus thermosulfidooxidans]
MKNLEVAPFSFNALANFDAVIGAASARGGSCNTTGMTRVLYPDDPLQGPVDGAALDPYPAQVPAHHGHDVAEVIPGLHVFVMSARMPVTHAHFHSLIISLKNKEITRAQVMEVLLHTPRTLFVTSTTSVISTRNVFDIGRELGRSRGDIYEGIIWENSVTVGEGELYMFMAVHQEAIVIPETMDGIRALMGTSSKEDSMRVWPNCPLLFGHIHLGTARPTRTDAADVVPGSPRAAHGPRNPVPSPPLSGDPRA